MRSAVIAIIVGLFAGASVYGLLHLRNQNNIRQHTAATTSVEKSAWEMVASVDETLAEPRLDAVHGRQRVITPKGGIISVPTADGWRVTLEIPAGAVTKDSLVQLIPLFVDNDPATLDTGFAVGPGTLRFAKPVMATYRRESGVEPFHFKAPAAYRLRPRTMELELQPIARAFLASHVIPVQITGGGIYMVSLVGSRREALARITLAAADPDGYAVLEAGTILLENGKNISPKEKEVLEQAIQTFLREGEQGLLGLDAATRVALGIEHPLPELRNVLTSICSEEQSDAASMRVAASIAGNIGYSDLQRSCVRSSLARFQTQIQTINAEEMPDSAVRLANQAALLGVLSDPEAASRLRAAHHVYIASLEAELRAREASTVVDAARYLLQSRVYPDGSYNNDVRGKTYVLQNAAASGRDGYTKFNPLLMPGDIPISGFERAVAGHAIALFARGLPADGPETAQHIRDAMVLKGEPPQVPADLEALCALLRAFGEEAPTYCEAARNQIQAAEEELRVSLDVPSQPFLRLLNPTSPLIKNPAPSPDASDLKLRNNRMMIR